MRPWFQNPELVKMVADAGLEGGGKLREMFRIDWDAAEQSKKVDQAHQLAIRQHCLSALALAVALLAALTPLASPVVRGEPARPTFRFESTSGFLLRYNTETGQSCAYHSFSGIPPETAGMEWCARQDRARTP